MTNFPTRRQSGATKDRLSFTALTPLLMFHFSGFLLSYLEILYLSLGLKVGSIKHQRKFVQRIILTRLQKPKITKNKLVNVFMTCLKKDLRYKENWFNSSCPTCLSTVSTVTSCHFWSFLAKALILFVFYPTALI